jgi:hypothetical protein
MKSEHLRACIFLALSLVSLPVPGQDAAPARAAVTPASTAAAAAEQQGFDEKFKQLAAEIDTLRDANQLLQAKLSALNEDLQKIRAEQARVAASAVGRDDLKPLAQKIDDVDKKRMEDKETISQEIKDSAARLEKLLAPAADSSPRPSIHTPAAVPPSATPPATPPVAVDGFSYTIKDGDRPRDIVNAYNADFKSKGVKTITLQQVIDANPGVDWKRLKIGQKIVIPRPAGYPAS